MTRSKTLLALAALTLSLPAAVAACGGGEGEDPEQVLEETFDNPDAITSGVVDLELEASVQGEQSGTFSIAVSGPFQTPADGSATLPQLDWEVSAGGEGAGGGVDFEGRIVVTADNAYVEVDRRVYEVGEATFARALARIEQGRPGGGPLSQIGLFGPGIGALTEGLGAACREQIEAAGGDASVCDVDPLEWVRNLENEGVEDLGGTDVIQVSGDADVEALLRDLVEIGQQTNPRSVPTDPAALDTALGQVDSIVEEASFSLYTGSDDRLLRGLDLDLGVELPSLVTAGGAIDASLSVRVSEANSEQRIEAPPGPTRPIQELPPPGDGAGPLGGGLELPGQG